MSSQLRRRVSTAKAWATRPRGAVICAALLLFVALGLAFVPVEARVPDAGPSTRYFEVSCGLPIGIVAPVAGTPLWETAGSDVGPCLHAAYTRLILAILATSAAALLLCHTRVRLRMSHQLDSVNREMRRES